MFAAPSCVGTVSGFNRTLTNQININGSPLTSKSLSLQLSRKFHSPKCQSFLYGVFSRSSKHSGPGKTSKDSTQPQVFQKSLDSLKIAVDQNSGKIDKLNANIQSVLQHEKGLDEAINTLRVALDQSSTKIDDLNKTIQSVLQQLSELQVDSPANRLPVPTQNGQKTTTTTNPPNEQHTVSVLGKRKQEDSNPEDPKRRKVCGPEASLGGYRDKSGP